jgi:hypothetical protein
MIWRQMRISRRHRYRSMAEELLDGPEVDAGHNQARSESVSQIVPGKILDLCFL